MRDLPVFTTENGVASLILKEIPYRQEGYIRIQDSRDPGALLEECVSFCRAAGAEKIYATGHEICEAYPVHTKILQMQGVCRIQPTNACLFPVQEHTVDRWLEIYNKKMQFVDNAAHLSKSQAMELVDRGDAYFIHRDAHLVGIAAVNNATLMAVASCVKDGGVQILSALCNGLGLSELKLEVASTNEKALKLYESFGMTIVGEKSVWYRVLG